MTRRSLPWVAGALFLASGTAWSQIPTIHTVDTGGVGSYTSVAFGMDGLPLISYYDVANGDLKVAHCLDVACAASTKQAIDTAGDVGRLSSIAVGADGRGVISYMDVTNGKLKVAHCNDLACTSATTAPLANLTAVGASGTGIAIAGGLPTIVFTNGGGPFQAARCVDVACSAATIASPGAGGRNPTMAIGGDGLPVIAADTIDRIHVGHCHDAACTTASFIVYGNTPEGNITFRFDDPSLATAPDGRVAVVFNQVTTIPLQIPRNDVRIMRCADATCTSLTPSGTIFVGMGTLTSDNPSLGILPNDRPLAAWTRLEGTTPQLQLGLCNGPDCAGAFVPVVDGPGTGLYATVAVSPAGDILIAYHDQSVGSLKTGHFAAPTPGTDLAVLVTDAPDPVAPTQSLHYLISGQNLGAQEATGVTASLALPPGVSYQTGSFGCQYDATAHVVTCPGPNIPAANTAQVALIDVMVPPGLPGPLDGTASIAAAAADPVPSNNTASVSTATRLGLRVNPAAVIEGQSGLVDALIDLTVIDDGHGLPSPLTLSYGTAAGSATPGTDYVEAAGSLTFASASTQTVAVSVVGDVRPESNETFYLLPSVPPGVIVVDNPATTIVDDDVTLAARIELGHGSSRQADLRDAPQDLFRVVVPGRASYEVVVDAASGDIAPLDVQRLDATGTAVLQSGGPTGAGPSVSLRWQNTASSAVANQLIRVRSGGCTTDCGPDDVYRVRAYETTARIPRFNNTATQVTVLILQNPSDRPVSGTVDFWTAGGQRIASSALAIAPHGTSVTSTAGLAPAQSGSVTVSHDAPYGVLGGKAVALEPATGFSFDSPLEYRPR